MRIGHAYLQLTRLDSSVLVALSIFIPLLVRTKDIGLSLGKAMPVLFIGMCTFIANDLDDVEKDRINHPERPLPSGHIKTSFAAALYFSCLVSALVTTKIYVQAETAFWYYLLLTFSISYGYVVDCLPGLKSFYVACTISVPILIVTISCPGEERLYLVAASAFLFVLGRELCMDLVDRAGDAFSFMHRVEAKPLAAAAFLLQVTGFLLLVSQVDELLDVADLLLVGALLTSAYYYWFRRASYKKAITIMKLQLFAGLYFLV